MSRLVVLFRSVVVLGVMDASATLAELGIDDVEPSLTDVDLIISMIFEAQDGQVP